MAYSLALPELSPGLLSRLGVSEAKSRNELNLGRGSIKVWYSQPHSLQMVLYPDGATFGQAFFMFPEGGNSVAAAYLGHRPVPGFERLAGLGVADRVVNSFLDGIEAALGSEAHVAHSRVIPESCASRIVEYFLDAFSKELGQAAP